MRELKPLIILYLEKFETGDCSIRLKPSLDESKFDDIKRLVMSLWITEDVWYELTWEFLSIDIKYSRKIREHLNWIRENPDISGNVYWNKEKILDKIEEIMRWHSAKK